MAVKLIKSDEYQTSFYSKLVSKSDIMFVSQELSKTITNLLGMPSTPRVWDQELHIFFSTTIMSRLVRMRTKSL